MKKPIRKADSMGKDRRALGDAKLKAADKIMDKVFDSNGTLADSRKRKLGGLYKGAKMKAWGLLEEEGKIYKESKQIEKSGARMAKASAMRKANLDKIKKKNG